jgi:carboxyl-terminal processing protease
VRYNYIQITDDLGDIMIKKRRTHAVAKAADPAAVHVKKTGLSTNIWLLVIATTAITGFFVGTRSDHILAIVAPLFGQKASTGQLDLSSVQATYRALSANFDGTLDETALVEGANRGLVASLNDQYTIFMNAKEASAFQDDLTGTIGGGIGAEISIRSEKVTIIRVLKDNPAIKAGLLAGDVVAKINDESTDGWTVEKAVGKIRGEEGTTVKLQVQRGTEAKEFTVTRAVVTNPSVDSSVNNGIGTLTISRFDGETGSLARAAAKSFKDQNVQSVVLDLRGNGGGYVDAAQDVAGLWLNNKVIVTERTNGKVVDELKSGTNPILAGIPTVVLVNGSSASASEIVAGALQDYGVAKLFGEQTFGKGSVQRLVGLPDGAQLKVTIARWYTPNGKNITTEGIKVDVPVALTQDDANAGKDPQMDAAIKQLGL